MPPVLSSQGLRPERAPRLRRAATLIEDGAERSNSPADARDLARRMRQRATELECGGHDPEQIDQLSAEIQALRFELG